MRHLAIALALGLLGCGGTAPVEEPAAAPGAGAGGATSSSSATASSSASGTGGAGGTAEPVPYPAPDWPTATPEDEGIDPAGLDEAAAIAEKDGSFCLLVIRHGALVSERYWNGKDATSKNPSWSIAKTYTSVLVGIAIERGDIASLDDSAADYVPEWKGTDREPITIRNLVSMTAGLKWDAFDDYVTMATFAPDKTKYALGLAVDHAPGTGWTYHNGAVQVLEAVFRGATGGTLEAYAKAHLWSKIGSDASWEHDDVGHPTAYANVLASCRDHARLGYLFLHGGAWAGEQVVPAAWVTQSLTPSQADNRAYGFLWWLNAETPALDAMMKPWPGRMVPFAPPDLFAARGFGNQFVDVIPSLDLVVVRFGPDPQTQLDLVKLATDQRFEEHDAILAPILAAVAP